MKAPRQPRCRPQAPCRPDTGASCLRILPPIRLTQPASPWGVFVPARSRRPVPPMKKPGETVRSVSFCCRTLHGPRSPEMNGRFERVQASVSRLAIVLITGRLATGSYGRPRNGRAPTPRRKPPKHSPRRFWKGLHCAGLAADPTRLPADLVDAADHRLTLTALTSGDVAQIARVLCGRKPTDGLTEAQAAILTPRHLRLARRRVASP